MGLTRKNVSFVRLKSKVDLKSFAISNGALRGMGQALMHCSSSASELRSALSVSGALLDLCHEKISGAHMPRKQDAIDRPTEKCFPAHIALIYAKAPPRSCPLLPRALETVLSLNIIPSA